MADGAAAVAGSGVGGVFAVGMGSVVAGICELGDTTAGGPGGASQAG